MADFTLQIVAVVVAIGTFIFYVRQEGRAKKTQLSAMYLQRYWEIDDDLLKAPKGTEDYRRHVHRLLILAEDEFDAARSGHLDPRYWEKWHGWIAHPSQREQRSADLRLVDPDAARFEHLRICLGGPETEPSPHHEWKQCPARRS